MFQRILVAVTLWPAVLLAAEGGAQLRSVSFGDENVYAVAFDRSGKHALCAGGGWDREKQQPRDCDVRLIELSTGRTIRTFAGHTAWVQAIVALPDGKRFVSASKDGTIRVWDLASGRELRKLSGHTYNVNALALLPDGRHLVSAAGGWHIGNEARPDSSLRLWDLETGIDLQRFPSDAPIPGAPARQVDPAQDLPPLEYRGVQHSFYAAAVSPDGRHVVTGGSYPSLVRVWEIATGREFRRFEGHTEVIFAVGFLPDNRRVVSGCADKTVRIWDIERDGEVARWETIDSIVRSVVVSADGTQILTGTGDYDLGRRQSFEEHPINCLVQLWDVASGRELARCVGSEHYVSAVALAPDQRHALSGGRDHALRYWDLQSPEARASVPTTRPRTYELRRFDDGGAGGGAGDASFADDGRTVYIRRGSGVIAHDVATAQERWRVEIPVPEREWSPALPAISPDASLIAFGGDIVRVRRLPQGEEVIQFKRDEKLRSGGFGIDFLPDNRRALLTSGDDVAVLVDLLTGELLRRFELMRKDYNGSVSIGGLVEPAISPDGKRFVLNGRRGFAHVYDIESGRTVASFEVGSQSPDALTFTPDGRMLLTGDMHGAVVMWNVEKKTEQARFRATLAAIRDLAVSRDGRRIAAGDQQGIIHVWDISGGKEVRRLHGHRQSIHSVAFSPDGQALVSTSQDATVRLWDVDVAR